MGTSKENLTSENSNFIETLILALSEHMRLLEERRLEEEFPREVYPEEIVGYGYLSLSSEEYRSDEKSTRQTWVEECFDQLGWKYQINTVSRPASWKHIEKDIIKIVQFAYEQKQENPRRRIYVYIDDYAEFCRRIPKGMQILLGEWVEVFALYFLAEEASREEYEASLGEPMDPNDPDYWDILINQGDSE